MANQFTNPFTNPSGFFSTQPGGFFAEPQGGNTLTGLLGDPRVNIGLAIAQGQPIGQAIMGGALQAQQIRQALTPEEEKPSERELRIEDIMTTFGINRAEALKYDKGLIKLGEEKGSPVLIDTVTGIKTPVGQTISQKLNESSAISTEGENLIANQIPNFMVTAPTAVEKAYSDSTRDDAILLAGATDTGIEAANQISQILQAKPNLAGVLGTLARSGKSLFGTISDLQSIKGVPDVFSEQALSQFDDPDISRIAILEERVVNAMADTAAKKGGRTPTTALREEQRQKLNLTGFTDSASVITRLQEVAKELNKDSMQLQTVKGGFNTELFGDRVKDYSLDPAYNILFEPTRIRLNASDYTN
tara:strand:+ start:14769 stop:15851 length:1083 start_codon:yes stop_codon:yes gene_type:complete